MGAVRAGDAQMTISVIIVTLNRPECVKRCLDCLDAQAQRPDQVIVVDASPDDQTRLVASGHPEVIYLRNVLGYGHMSHGRNVGLKSSIGEIVAFIDDDAYVHPAWTQSILAPYCDPEVGAVGGRAL